MGDIDGILPFIPQKDRGGFEDDLKGNRKAIIYALTQRPSEVEIGAPVINGESASFTIRGSMPSGEGATGSILMMLEEGRWMVSEDKWEFTVK